MTTASLPPLPDDLVEILNARLGGFNQTIGLRFTSASYTEMRAELPVRAALHQPYGLVHGGVYAAMIETLASAGAALNAMPGGRRTVGLENTTSFLRAVREGTLRGLAQPLTRGRRTQVWEVTIRDDDDRVVASGRVRLLCVEQDAEVGGEMLSYHENGT